MRVRDAGIGIRPEMLPKVFNMFVQVGELREYAQGGLGIGLSLVRTLVEMQAARSPTGSTGRGTGSEFVVRMPVLPEARENAAPAQGPHRRPADKPPRRRILVVDDSINAAKSLARLLPRLYDQEVRLAHDGPEAPSVAGEFRPEIVVLDIGLPGMDGNEVARRLREWPEFETMPLVALTGWGQGAGVERSRAAGSDHHLVKPANPEAIIELLSENGKGEV